jgi:hypothetical protein
VSGSQAVFDAEREIEEIEIVKSGLPSRSKAASHRDPLAAALNSNAHGGDGRQRKAEWDQSPTQRKLF